jgi:hypothetical protein
MVLCLLWSGINEMIGPTLQCRDPLYRQNELMLRRMPIQDSTGGDFVSESRAYWVGCAESSR